MISVQENRRLDLQKSLVKGLNILIGPPSIGKSTLLNEFKNKDGIMVKTGDLFSEKEFNSLSESQKEMNKSMFILDYLTNHLKDNSLKYVVDAHPFFIEEMLDEIKHLDSVNIILLVDKFPVPDEACLRYANNGGGNPEHSRRKYSVYYYDLIDFLSEDIENKFCKKTLLLQTLVTTYLFK